MQPIDLLISARWVLTVEESIPYDHHSVAINQGLIVDLLPTKEAKARYQPKDSFNLEHHMLMPGFINMHGHVPMTLMRGLADDLPLMTWLNDHIWPAEAKFMGPEFVKDGASLAIAEMIRSGTTTFSDHYFFAEDTAQIATELGIRACLFPTTLEFATPHGQGPNDYLSKNIALHKAYQENDLITIGFGPHAPYTVSDDTFKDMVAAVKELGAFIQIHLHETAHEVQESLEKFRKRPTERLAELGAFDCAPFQAVHVTQVDDIDIELFLKHGVHLVHCPESNLKLASGFCPVDRLQKAGVPLCLGTDGAASNNDLDMMSEMRTAALLAKAVSGNAEALPAFDAIKMATLSGAQAMGAGEKIGSIKVGKEADIIAVDFSQIESQPLYDPVSHLVYCTTSDKVTHSWIQGKIKMKNRQLTNIDTDALTAKVASWRSNIRAI
jgi:5-methylthioadenosine/S-adenosylhomocysteine deaminase